MRAPKQRIADEDELLEYRVSKRKHFENVLRRQRMNIGIWVKCARRLPPPPSGTVKLSNRTGSKMQILKGLAASICFNFGVCALFPQE